MSKIGEFFEENGYIIVPANLKLLEELRKIIFSVIQKHINLKISKDNSKNITEVFNNFHKFVSAKDINKLRFEIYNKINSKKEFSEIYYEIFKDYLDDLVGNELSMQKKINLSIQMPKDKDSLLDIHSDIYAGESPFQVVAWTPLVDVYDTKSMFGAKKIYNKMLNKDMLNNSKNTTKEIYNKNKNKFRHFKINFGNVLIFSPLILHGNTINQTKETRFSLNVRFKSLLSPYDVIQKSHRNIPNFYRPLNIKPLTKIGFNYIKNFQN